MSLTTKPVKSASFPVDQANPVAKNASTGSVSKFAAKGVFTRVKSVVGLNTATAESNRLHQDRKKLANWKRWGPYLSERQWATVREDYSPNGSW